MHTMKFGLVPAWFRHEDNKLSTFNARAEGLVETGGLWETMKKQKRCIVVAQGFAVQSSFSTPLAGTEPTGPATTNGSRKVRRIGSRTLSNIKMEGSCYSLDSMTVQTLKVVYALDEKAGLLLKEL